MVAKSELMGVGMPASLANKIGQDGPATGLTATGSNQAGALALTSTMSIFSTVAASTGCVLPNAEGKGEFIVINNGANALSVYPNGTQTINGGSAGAAVSIPAGKMGLFIGNGIIWAANISA